MPPRISRFLALGRRSMLPLCLTIPTVFVVPAWGQASPPPFPTITDLGVLPGGAITSVLDVSGDGKIVVGKCFTQPGGWRAFRWENGVMQNLGVLPGGNSSSAVGASQDGSVVMGGSNSTTFASLAAFVWKKPGPMTSPVTNLANYWEAFGVSGSGLVGVGYSGNTNLAVRWTSATGKVTLGTLPGHVSSVAYATNSDGSVVVGGSAAAFPGGGSAFRWTSAGGMVSLGVLPGDITSNAVAVSPDGTTVVGMSTAPSVQQRAFRWTQDELMTNLGTLGGPHSYATGVDGAGRRIVGSSHTAANQNHAFLWTPELGMVDLNTYLPTLGMDLTGWQLTGPCAISDDGTVIVGDGQLNFFNRGWIVNLERDTDADGLMDSWETEGVPYKDSLGAVKRLVLPNADPMGKDLYVEVDGMQGHSLTPGADLKLFQAFLDAPVSNPSSVDGINLHIVEDDNDLPLIPVWQTDGCWPLTFATVRENHFGSFDERNHPDSEALLKAKAKAYRYCVLAEFGSPNLGGCGQQPGDNFVIFQGLITSADRDASVFMHELGHNLNLDHGGGDPMNGKPNYPSIMNYTLAYPYDWCKSFRKLDYSRAGYEEFNELDENSLDENAGVGSPSGLYTGYYMPFGVNIDVGGTTVRTISFVNLFGTPTDFGDTFGDGFQDGRFTTGVKQDLNYVAKKPPGISLPTDPSPGEILRPHNDWANVILPLLAVRKPSAIPVFPQDELTIEAVDWINQNFPKAPSPCYADCDASAELTIDDFICFQTFFALGDPYADCDGDGGLTIDDFICFQTFFAIGC
jgi:probable HAF family extracellular repeat protein